jgi:hypothetical protein
MMSVTSVTYLLYLLQAATFNKFTFLEFMHHHQAKKPIKLQILHACTNKQEGTCGCTLAFMQNVYWGHYLKMLSVGLTLFRAQPAHLEEKVQVCTEFSSHAFYT